MSVRSLADPDDDDRCGADLSCCLCTVSRLVPALNALIVMRENSSTPCPMSMAWSTNCKSGVTTYPNSLGDVWMLWSVAVSARLSDLQTLERVLYAGCGVCLEGLPEVLSFV